MGLSVAALLLEDSTGLFTGSHAPNWICIFHSFHSSCSSLSIFIFRLLLQWDTYQVTHRHRRSSIATWELTNLLIWGDAPRRALFTHDPRTYILWWIWVIINQPQKWVGERPNTDWSGRLRDVHQGYQGLIAETNSSWRITTQECHGSRFDPGSVDPGWLNGVPKSRELRTEVVFLQGGT